MKDKMLLKYIVTFPLGVLGTAFIFVIIGYGATLLSFGYIFKLMEYRFFEHIIVAVFILVSSYLTYFSIVFKYERKAKLAEKDANIWKASVLEQSSGYPSLMNAIQEYEKLKDEELAETLATKKHPALKASEVVRRETKRRRIAEFENRQTRALIEYFESIAPFLLDFKDDIIDNKNGKNILCDYTEIERADPATNYLTKQEYRKLSTAEKNQLALDRFWNRPKSKSLIGRLYERYVGFLYESKGYSVDYVGIFKGFEDLGRDLICKKGKEVLVIQCKNWSQFKTIYEKHIFQFFGTVFQYKDSYPTNSVKGIFHTTTQVSELARRFANELGIELIENHVFDQNYPCIKCNINPSTKEKIYHLPFDQMYDKTKVNTTGEFYCRTVKEAELKGFRRAFRWRGNNKK
ncbi:MAG: restriction endonuclease [Methanomassiliicoccales archaeon]|nr:MAG: restriction endonuclease [Methanomassiliicoccales archaeon]